jgi:hypothetical protein
MGLEIRESVPLAAVMAVLFARVGIALKFVGQDGVLRDGLGKVAGREVWVGVWKDGTDECSSGYGAQRSGLQRHDVGE